MDRNHYRKLQLRQGVVERYRHAATHTMPQGKAVMDKRVTGHVHTMSGHPWWAHPGKIGKATCNGFHRPEGLRPDERNSRRPQRTSSKGTTVRWTLRQECSNRDKGLQGLRADTEVPVWEGGERTCCPHNSSSMDTTGRWNRRQRGSDWNADTRK